MSPFTPNPRPLRARQTTNATFNTFRHRLQHRSSNVQISRPTGRAIVQPMEPMLLPKLRIYLADFPWSHCSIDQRLYTSESGCGSRYGPMLRERLGRRVPSHAPTGRMQDSESIERSVEVRWGFHKQNLGTEERHKKMRRECADGCAAYHHLK